MSGGFSGKQGPAYNVVGGVLLALLVWAFIVVAFSSLGGA